jgi:hypothetical protein
MAATASRGEEHRGEDQSITGSSDDRDDRLKTRRLSESSLSGVSDEGRRDHLLGSGA